MDVLARCVRGLEWIVAEEISTRCVPSAPPTLAPREVRFRYGSGPDSVAADLLGLRTVDDVLLRVGELDGVGTTRAVPAALADRLAGLDWAAAFAGLAPVRPVPAQPAFDVVASLDGGRRFNRYALEQAAGERLGPIIGGRFLARTAQGRAPGEADLTVRLFVRGDQAVAALRLAARPLHRRAYKLDTGPGTLHPPLAAALVRLAALPSGSAVADPFCGDGTIAIEAALAVPDVRVRAADLDAARLDHARRNAGRAGVEIAFARLDAGRLPWPAGGLDALITNPPWNVAVEAAGTLARSLDRFWRLVPGLLSAPGRVCLVADAELGTPAQLARHGVPVGLAARVRLAGRVSDLLLGGSPLPASLREWRDRALAAGVAGDAGF